MTYEITLEDFGFTKRRLLLEVGGLFAIVTLWEIVFFFVSNLFWPGLTSWPLKNPLAAILGAVLIGGTFVLWWSSAHNYSLEIDENAARVGRRVVRKGQVRYMRELNRRLLEGPQLILSEHGSLWVQFLGGAVKVPKGLPEYEHIKSQLSAWLAEAAPHAGK